MADTPILTFDADVKEIPVKLKIKGVVIDFILKEMTGEEKDKYTSHMNSYFDPATRRIKKFEGQHAHLISRCLYSKEEGKYATEEFIQANISSSTQIKLHRECEILNGLDEGASDREKKES